MQRGFDVLSCSADGVGHRRMGVHGALLASHGFLADHEVDDWVPSVSRGVRKDRKAEKRAIRECMRA